MVERYLPLPDLPPWLEGFVTTRGDAHDDGRYGFNLALHVDDHAPRVERHRQELCATWGLRGVQWLEQVHGARVVSVDAVAPEHYTADGLCTAIPGVALGILTADCVPIVLWREDVPRVAAVHAGWQGLVAGVIAAAVEALGAGPIRAVIAPCISAARYEVGAAVWERFATHADVLREHPDDPAKRLLDLRAVAASQMAALGIESAAMPQCSYDDPRLYSHRRATHEGTVPCGRFATVVYLRE
ncbi:MAG: polyphenol oxidase family protein [Pseudomonadota bacterium]